MQKSLHREEYKTLIKLIYHLRVSKDLRQEDLAQKLGVHQSFISKIEGGERRVDLVELLDICAALDTPFSDFLDKFTREINAT
jgi:transcriptional regulator with XRE-family HTH domain